MRRTVVLYNPVCEDPPVDSPAPPSVSSAGQAAHFFQVSLSSPCVLPAAERTIRRVAVLARFCVAASPGVELCDPRLASKTRREPGAEPAVLSRVWSNIERPILGNDRGNVSLDSRLHGTSTQSKVVVHHLRSSSP